MAPGSSTRSWLKSIISKALPSYKSKTTTADEQQETHVAERSLHSVPVMVIAQTLDSQSPSPGPERTPTGFSDLPYEIRTMIWQATLTPRVIELLPSRYFHSLYSKTELPVGLAVCCDSREILLPLYPLCFGSVVLPPRVRVNFESDTVLLSEYEYYGSYKNLVIQFLSILGSSGNVLSSLRYLAINQLMVPDDAWKRAVNAMIGLKEVIVFDEYPRVDYYHMKAELWDLDNWKSYGNNMVLYDPEDAPEEEPDSINQRVDPHQFTRVYAQFKSALKDSTTAIVTPKFASRMPPMRSCGALK